MFLYKIDMLRSQRTNRLQSTMAILPWRSFHYNATTSKTQQILLSVVLPEIHRRGHFPVNKQPTPFFFSLRLGIFSTLLLGCPQRQRWCRVNLARWLQKPVLISGGKNRRIEGTWAISNYMPSNSVVTLPIDSASDNNLSPNIWTDSCDSCLIFFNWDRACSSSVTDPKWARSYLSVSAQVALLFAFWNRSM